MKKRVISLFLALSLLVGLSPAVWAANDTGFTDVSESDWFYTPVQWAVDNGITSGLTPNTFGPNVTCTRGQVVTFLWAAAGKPTPTSTANPFRDVAGSDWFYTPVLWAVENGITGGISPDAFGPNDPCTRAQVVTFLWAAAGKPAPASADTPFTDVAESDWFCQPVLWAVENGITSGLSPNTFGADSPCTRGQIVTFLYAARNVSNGPDKELIEQFEAQSIHDFPAHLVINFDSDPETNFGVLNEDVIRWENEPITAEKIYDGEQTKYIFSDAEMLKDIPLGSVIYVCSAGGKPYLVSLGSVDGNVVTTDPDTPMSNYYTYLDADIVTTIDTAAMQRSESGSSSRSGSSSSGSNGITFTPNLENGLTIGGVLDGEHFSLGMTGSVTAKTGGHIHYDVVHFGRDYIDFMMESTVEFSADVTGTAKISAPNHSLNEELEVDEFPLVTIIPGLDLTLEVKLPIKMEAKVGFTGSIKVAKTERVEYLNTYEKPIHTEEGETNDVYITCKGQVELKTGVAAEIGADFLDDKLELVLELTLMGGVRGTPEVPKHEFTGDPKSVHMCDLCIKGELFAEVSGEIKFQANISKKTKLELVTIPLLKLEIPLDAFYVSLESPADSVHKGELTFGFGSCPNYKQRVGFVTRLFDGTLLPESYIVELTAEGDPTINVCISTEYVYLYDGKYTAAMERDGQMGRPATFTIKGFPEEITLYASKGTEKDIYTAYLVNGGYDELTNMSTDYHANDASISTVLGDFDNNGIRDLWLYFSNFWWGGSNGNLPKFTALYTIDKETEEVVVIDTFMTGSPDGSKLSFMRDANTDEHFLVLNTLDYLDDTTTNKVEVYTVQRFNGQSLVSGDSYRIEKFRYPYVDETYAEIIENIKKGPHIIDDYWQSITAYYLNDVQVTKEEYESAFALTSTLTDSAYKSYNGTYRNPIK